MPKCVMVAQAQRRVRETLLVQAILTAATMNLRKLAQHIQRIVLEQRY